MTTNAATFAVPRDQRELVLAMLVDLGFTIGAAEPVTTTLLDTFDGRLNGDGLQLALHEAGGRELTLSGPDVVTARLTLPSVPRFARDLPSGPFRSRLLALLDVRALLPVVRTTSSATTAVLRNAIDKTIATAVLHEQIRIHGTDAAPDVALLEVHEVVGFDKRSRRAIEAAEHMGLEQANGPLLEVAARISGAHLAGFVDTPSVPLDRMTPAVEGFTAVLANLARTIDANWQGTIDEIDPEFLHDLRVAVRRTRAVLTQGKRVLPRSVLDVARDRFGWLGGLTGPARDLDVYLIEWDGYTRPLGAEAILALTPVRALLEHRGVAAHSQLAAGLRSAEARDLMTSWHYWLGSMRQLQPQGEHAERPVGAVVRRRIIGAHKQLVGQGRQIGPDTPAEHLHDLRKDAEKLRYLLECFGGLLPPDGTKQFVRRLKGLQDNLGEHQDAEVHVSLIREIADELHSRRVAPETMLALGQLTGRLEQIRIDTRAEFAERFTTYDTKDTRRALDATIDGLGS